MEKKIFTISFIILDIPEDIDDQKEDEKLAIQSIYGDSALIEKIPGKLWELKLEIPSLIETLTPSPAKKSARDTGITREMLEKDANVCQWFLRGHCKFGKRCYKKHVMPDKDYVVDDKHLKDLDGDEKVFILEIRFVIFLSKDFYLETFFGNTGRRAPTTPSSFESGLGQFC